MIGDCYQAAAKLALRQWRSLDYPGADVPRGPLVLVHGIARLRNEPSVRFGHAWCENEERTIAFDYSNGRRVMMPAAYFYDLGSIDPSESIVYSEREALEAITSFGHWGPWRELPPGVR